jgi:hypothetical protein
VKIFLVGPRVVAGGAVDEMAVTGPSKSVVPERDGLGYDPAVFWR